MDLFELYTAKDTIDQQMGYVRSQLQVYSKLPINLPRQIIVIPKSNLEAKGVPRHTAQFFYYSGGKSFTEGCGAPLCRESIIRIWKGCII